jgi:general stress protein YciG
MGQPTKKGKQGFASMDKTKQRELAAKGGYSAHAKGVAHIWTSEEAKRAGQKGGKMNKGKTRKEREN